MQAKRRLLQRINVPLDVPGQLRSLGFRPPKLETALQQIDALGQRFRQGSSSAKTSNESTSLLEIRSGGAPKRVHSRIAADGTISAKTVEVYHSGAGSERIRAHIERQASLDLYRRFDHPRHDATFRELIELDLRGHHRVRSQTLRKFEGRHEQPLRDEFEHRRHALSVLLARPDLSEDLTVAALGKLAECGKPEDLAVIDMALGHHSTEAVVEAAAVATAKIHKAAKMTIVLAAFESKPYVNGGGLGNVMKELPPALARMGHEVVVVLPRHSVIERGKLRETGDVGVVYGSKTEKFGLFHDRREGVDYYFIENDTYFSSGRDGVYRDSYGDYGDTFERYDFFGAALPVAIRTILGDKKPDVVQLNDAHTGSAATYLKSDPAFRETACIMAVHNLGAAYQGRYDEDRLDGTRLRDLGVYYPAGPAEAWGQVNLLKLGLTASDAAITVSRHYMHEALEAEGGEGLHGVLSELRQSDELWGNLNGIDTAAWNSQTDPLLAANFSIDEPAGKGVCKADLQRRVGLPERPDTPVIGVVARLSHQKGIDEIAGSVRHLLERGRDLQIVVCGEGEEALADELRQLQSDYPENVAFDPVFEPDKEHHILGGSDFFLMPSRFEPCGLPQMYALRYLTVPIVRAVGGLEESIDDYDAESRKGNGFKFTNDLPQAIGRALDWHGSPAADRRKLLENCAASDFSWDTTSAPEQVAFFRQISNRKNA